MPPAHHSARPVAIWRRFAAAGLLGAGLAALAAGIAIMPATSGGGTAVSAVGTPAYAALYTITVDRGWFFGGAAAAVVGGVAVAACLLSGGRLRRLATAGAVVAVIGLLAVLWGWFPVPRTLDGSGLGDPVSDFPAVELPLRGRDAIDIGLAWTLLGLLAAWSVSWRPRHPRPS